MVVFPSYFRKGIPISDVFRSSSVSYLSLAKHWPKGRKWDHSTATGGLVTLTKHVNNDEQGQGWVDSEPGAKKQGFAVRTATGSMAQGGNATTISRERVKFSGSDASNRQDRKPHRYS